jgi:signal transduction histidine kinase
MRSRAILHNFLARILGRYGILLAGLFIFAYYLWSTLNLFESAQPKKDFQGYLLQFDTLIVLWLLLVAVSKVHEYRKKERERDEQNQRIVVEHEKQKMRLQMLDDVTAHLTDAINNPLSIIAISAGSLRERFTADRDVASFLDRIEGALRRLKEVLTDFQSNQTRKIMKSTDQLVEPPRADQLGPASSSGGSTVS